jgi:hypothetical protein
MDFTDFRLYGLLLWEPIRYATGVCGRAVFRQECRHALCPKDYALVRIRVAGSVGGDDVAEDKVAAVRQIHVREIVLGQVERGRDRFVGIARI